jgi:hypothetical protein
VKAGLFNTSLTLSEDLDLMARVALQGPFGLIREELIEVCRRDEPIACLTAQAMENPIQAREWDEGIYEKLKQIQTLKYEELKSLNEVMSANRRAIGNLLLRDGKRTEARECYKRSFAVDRSPASLGRYVLSFLPSRPHLWIVERMSNLKAKRKKAGRAAGLP